MKTMQKLLQSLLCCDQISMFPIGHEAGTKSEAILTDRRQDFLFRNLRRRLQLSLALSSALLSLPFLLHCFFFYSDFTSYCHLPRSAVVYTILAALASCHERQLHFFHRNFYHHVLQQTRLPSSFLPGTRPRRRPLPTATIRRRSQRLLQPRRPRRLPTPTKLRISSSSKLWLRIAAAPRPADVLSAAGISASATAAGVLSGSAGSRRVNWGWYLRGYNGGAGMLLLFGLDFLG
ncbi:uncharacterized protein ASPGLDRAFT_967381 [Aspergillus glaucus CBS 516.65]|uniref:Uncharacterized protein n=1 Tax=Aspergillus glaucus CBS 516.65 TaxID=1160497 RepID=A0A1L9VUH5_ASPGL|nr:hypothetical protein ASPGLDRAFT_967381 [Aspergillus glaucus CBS 516.65]OJJ87578.1 hypothetical protein ASPGLDRAFT_967381 [Aspergillus glaucus CBS 516.65]